MKQISKFPERLASHPRIETLQTNGFHTFHLDHTSDSMLLPEFCDRWFPSGWTYISTSQIHKRSCSPIWWWLSWAKKVRAHPIGFVTYLQSKHYGSLKTNAQNECIHTASNALDVRMSSDGLVCSNCGASCWVSTELWLRGVPRDYPISPGGIEPGHLKCAVDPPPPNEAQASFLKTSPQLIVLRFWRNRVHLHNNLPHDNTFIAKMKAQVWCELRSGAIRTPMNQISSLGFPLFLQVDVNFLRKNITFQHIVDQFATKIDVHLQKLTVTLKIWCSRFSFFLNVCVHNTAHGIVQQSAYE